MHHSGPLPLSVEGPEQGFLDKNCQNVSQGKPCVSWFGNVTNAETGIEINIIWLLGKTGKKKGLQCVKNSLADWLQWLYPRHTKYSFCWFHSSDCPSISLWFHLLTPAVTKFFYGVYLCSSYHKLLIFGMGVPGRVLFHSTSVGFWVISEAEQEVKS